MEKASPIFVVGPPRSGTTLIGKVLNQHDEIYTAGETNFFEDIWAARKKLGSLKVRDEIAAAAHKFCSSFGRYQEPAQRLVDRVIDEDKLIDQTLAQGGGYNALYECFMTTLARSQGKAFFCDDTPKHLFNTDTIFEQFPNAKVIGCMRDPRDFLNSYKNRWKVTSQSARVRSLYHPVITSMLWRGSANLLVKFSQKYGSERFHVISYEDFVRDPKKEISRICQFLGLPYTEELLSISWQNSSFASQSAGIFKDSVDRWRTQLGPEEIWWAQRIGGPRMAKFGYVPAQVSPATRRLIGDALMMPWALTRALRANAHRHVSTTAYLKRRFSAVWEQQS